MPSPTAVEGRAACGPLAGTFALVACLLRGPHDLADEALRSLGAPIAVTDAAGARAEVVVPVVMAANVFADPWDGARDVEIVGVSGESASSSDRLDVENLQSNQPHARGRRRRFYLAVRGRRVSVRCLHPDCVVQLRGMSGSFAAWRSFGDFETFREQGAPILVADSH
jgi:hypothetical protein